MWPVAYINFYKICTCENNTYYGIVTVVIISVCIQGFVMSSIGFFACIINFMAMIVSLL